MYDYDVKLKDKLYELRAKISREKNIYNEVDILTYASIREIASSYPETLEELSKIGGIGKIKLAKYGGYILDVVQKYVRENNIDTSNKKEILKKSEDKCEYDNDLYKLLTQKIIEIAQINNIPNSSYLILPPMALYEISRKYPIEKKALISISGIGNKRYDLFGEEILEIVKKYIQENQEKVKENLRKFSDKDEKEENKLKNESNEIRIALTQYSIEYPIFTDRINLFINSLYSLKRNFEKKDAMRLISGGEIKTLMRNVVEPLLNYALKEDTTYIEVISRIINRPDTRSSLIIKYNILPEELNALNTLYNYSNGCDHILDPRSKEEKNKIRDYILNFENTTISENEEVYINILKLIRKILTNEKIPQKFESLINTGI